LGLPDRNGPTSSHSSDESGLEVDAFADRRPRAPQTIQTQTNECRVKRRLTSTRLTQRERTDRPGTTTGGGPRNSERDHGSATVPLHSTLGIQEDNDPQGTLRARCGRGSPWTDLGADDKRRLVPLLTGTPIRLGPGPEGGAKKDLFCLIRVAPAARSKL
jgi:hypothetical protein